MTCRSCEMGLELVRARIVQLEAENARLQESAEREFHRAEAALACAKQAEAERDEALAQLEAMRAALERAKGHVFEGARILRESDDLSEGDDADDSHVQLMHAMDVLEKALSPSAPRPDVVIVAGGELVVEEPASTEDWSSGAITLDQHSHKLFPNDPKTCNHPNIAMYKIGVHQLKHLCLSCGAERFSGGK